MESRSFSYSKVDGELGVFQPDWHSNMDRVTLLPYKPSEEYLSKMTSLIEADLSEPYSIYTYRYFTVSWPELSYVAVKDSQIIGCIISKFDSDRQRGYIAMLAVEKCHRKQGIGKALVIRVLDELKAKGAKEVVLETEVGNSSGRGLYEGIGFIRDKRLKRYYLKGQDAFRLKLIL